MRVLLDQWEVPEHEAQSTAEVPQQHLHDMAGLPAVGAFIVAVLHQRHRRVVGAEAAIARANRRIEWVASGW